jgi:hypothetical protein
MTSDISGQDIVLADALSQANSVTTPLASSQEQGAVMPDISFLDEETCSGGSKSSSRACLIADKEGSSEYGR